MNISRIEAEAKAEIVDHCSEDQDNFLIIIICRNNEITDFDKLVNLFRDLGQI